LPRNDVCGIASKAYIEYLSPTHLISTFNRTGIYPFNTETIDETILSHSVILKEKENRAKTLVTEEPKSTNDEQNKDDESNDTVCEDECQVTSFLRNTLPQLKPKETKPRKTLPKFTSGKTITEDQTLGKIKELKEQSKGKSAQKTVRNQRGKISSAILQDTIIKLL
jgi:hypothetical protein